MFERPRSGERALLVHAFFGRSSARQYQDDCAEFELLARSAGAETLVSVRTLRATPEPRFLIGAGLVEELAALIAEVGAEVVLFNCALSPSQERNLERALKARVLDYTGLILDIFAQRARSHEGKLQVELAQLRHLSTRLVRGWTHLERQKGGIGLRGPGETQLETDRRLLNKRIEQLSQRLDRVQRQRHQQRRARDRRALPTLALVGYTNAGKSTLFNALTGAGALAADQLFATLDPTLRRLTLPGAGEVVLADTVGFVRNLPHELVAAFRATLEETREADLLLHVIDASDPQREERIAAVQAVLAEIGAGELPQLRVYNKIDVAGLPVRCQGQGVTPAVWVSAASGEGIGLLLEQLAEQITGGLTHCRLELGPGAGRVRALLHQWGAVREEVYSEAGGWTLTVALAGGQLAGIRDEPGVRVLAQTPHANVPDGDPALVATPGGAT